MVDNIKHKISFLYIEKAKIHQSDSSIVIVRGDKETYIPVCQLNALMLGCGVSITTEAIKNISSGGCMIFVCGVDGCPIYTIGRPQPTKTKNLLIQIDHFSDNKKHLNVARKMYEYRFPDKNMANFSINQMRGAEGRRMVEIYELYAKKYNIKWSGRKCKIDEIDDSDIVNRSITLANYMLYEICYAIICTLGFSPEIGFIHTGNDMSFVYDVADLYKTEVTIPVAFDVASEYKEGTHLPSIIREKLRLNLQDHRIMKRIVKDIYSLFEFKENSKEYPEDVCLYDCEKYTKSSVNYGNIY